jgi:uncharacterized protein YidB (DUF937 family)
MARGYPSMTALLGLLAVVGYQNRDKIAEVLGKLGKPGDPNQKEQGGLGGLLGQLGGASAGGVLSGGIGELIDRFREKGLGDTADSWVRTGANKELAPAQLEQAIGAEVLDTLSKQTGLSRHELLARLTRELPQAVDKFTPEGRVPTESEMSRTVGA